MVKPAPPTSLLFALHQRRWWVSSDGPIRVKEMETTHLINAVSWLERRAFSIRFRWETTLFRNAPDIVLDDLALGGSSGADDEWLEARPLMKALRKQLRKRGVCGRDCHCPCHAATLTPIHIEGDPYGC